MTLTTPLERMQRLDHLISMKATGTPQELADKLDISRRMLYEYLLAMKDMGLSIEYCKFSRNYFYVDGARLVIKVEKNDGVQ